MKDHPSPPPGPSGPRPRPRQGFALLITITLLAFLVMLLVSLAALTRVETQVASNNQQLSQARQNALLALNIAIGQLQKYAGPDQRVTSPADLVADTDKTGAASPATGGLAVKPGARYWTGVWGNRETQIGYTLTPSQINGRGVIPLQLGWLVSGNENGTYALANNGSVSAPTTPRFSPTLPVTGLTATTGVGDSLSYNITDPITGNATTPGILLVGGASTSDGSAAGKTASFNAGNYVVAPAVTITVPSGTLPGFDATSTTPTPIGRYAFWVGDEGVKARPNLQNGYQKTGQASDRINSFITSQRAAIEFMDRDYATSTTPINTSTETNYDFTNNGVPGIVSPSQVALLNTTNTVLSTAVKTHFHDITTTSYGVLSDTYAGGLKKDLTADIADTSSDFSYRPADGDPVFTPLSGSEQNQPTWGHFRNWARVHPDSATGAVDPDSTEARSAGIAPVILFTALGLDYYLTELSGTPAGRQVKMALYPFVVLYNPYPWPIKASDYDIGIRLGNYSGASDSRNAFQIRVKKPGVGNDATDNDYPTVAYADLNSVAIYPSAAIPAGLSNSFIRLKISKNDKNGTETPILPGQRYAYMLPSSNVSEYNHGNPPELRRVNTITDERNNYFTLTSAPIPGVFNDPADKIIFIADNGTGGGSAKTGIMFAETSVVLAKSGSLASTAWPTTSVNLYQSILNVFPIFQQAVGNRRLCQLTADTNPQTINDRLLTDSPRAKSVFRIAASNESGFYWSTIPRAGIAQNTKLPRYIADANIRAPFVTATAFENSSTLSMGDVAASRNGAFPFGAALRGALDDSSPPLYPGPSLDLSHYSIGLQDPGAGITTYAMLFDVLESNDKLLSLGQLQHVPWARYSFNTSYPFANSYAALRIDRDKTYRASGVRRASTQFTSGATTAPTDPLYDLSWLLNRSIWDRYFISSVPSGLTAANSTATLPNSRMTYYERAGVSVPLSSLKYNTGQPNEAYDKAAANLMVAGSFNINSTSEQAWRAILAGPKGLPTDSAYTAAADSVENAIPYPRFSRNITAVAGTSGPYAAHPNTMKINGTPVTQNDVIDIKQTTNRGLYLNNPAVTGNTSANSVVNELARSIVKEIRTRGPFLSLSDFINRPLVTTETGIKGALQAGLDNMDPAKAQVNPDVLTGTGPYVSMTSSNAEVTNYKWNPEHFMGKTATGTGKISTSRWALSPLQLTQADLLSSLGPLLSARSDTFIIRSYGEVINPLTQASEGRAWCEAVVQRVPDYMGNEAPETALASIPAASNSRTFGRKFKIVSFRWLSNSDI